MLTGIALLVIIVLAVIAIVAVIKYRQLRYICLCTGLNVRFKEDASGQLLIAAEDTSFVSLSNAYEYLSSPSMSNRRLMRTTYDTRLEDDSLQEVTNEQPQRDSTVG